MRRRILPAILVAVMVLGTVASGAAIGAVGAQSGGGGEAAAVDAGVHFDHNETHNATEENETEDENATDGNETDAFCQTVSAFVHGLQAHNSTSGPFGFHVATFVLANNPAADVIPDHAGPPANLTQGPAANATQGPPDHAGPDNSTDSGPPEDRGNDGGGPPDGAGNGDAGQPKLAMPW
jgi:hypothetical protein